MTTPNSYSPANVLRWLLVALGDLSDPTVVDADHLPTGAWPGYHSNEPEYPDNLVVLYDTEGVPSGRNMTDGRPIYHYGFQVRVRAREARTSHDKMRSLRDTLFAVLLRSVTIDSVPYLVHVVSGIGQIIPVGQDTPQSKRYAHTLNALISLSTPTGTPV